MDPDANIIFGMVTDLKMENEIKLTIIATGFPTAETLREREDHVGRMLQDALDGDGNPLDVPPFLRRYTTVRNQKRMVSGPRAFRRRLASAPHTAATQERRAAGPGGPLSLVHPPRAPSFHPSFSAPPSFSSLPSVITMKTACSAPSSSLL